MQSSPFSSTLWVLVQAIDDSVDKLDATTAVDTVERTLGLACAELGEPRTAIEYHEQAFVIAREVGDRRGERSALWNMDYAHETLGEREAALARAKAAFVISRAIKHPDVPQDAEWLR